MGHHAISWSQKVVRGIRSNARIHSSSSTFDPVNINLVKVLSDPLSRPCPSHSSKRECRRWHACDRNMRVAREVLSESFACQSLCSSLEIERQDFNKFSFQPAMPYVFDGQSERCRDLAAWRKQVQRQTHFGTQPTRTFHDFARRYKKFFEKSTLETGVKYEVLKLDESGDLEPLTLKSTQLGLHPRDVDLLSHHTFIPKRATISVQRDKVLIRMENVRAIVCKNQVLLFDARRPRMSVERPFFAPTNLEESNMCHRARDAFAKTLASQVKDIRPDFLHPMPFHLRVIESLLEETSIFFHRKVDRLKLLVERMLQELTDDFTMGGLQKLLPLRRAVTEVEHDVRDAHEAMDQVIRNDDVLDTMCSMHSSNTGGQPSAQDSERASAEGTSSAGEEGTYGLRQATADMLLTYQREVDDAGGALEELRKGIEAAQEVWELGLDTTRNRIIRINLYISLATACFGLSTLPAAFFGMNLVSGLEEHPSMFYWVLGGATVTPVVLLGLMAIAFRIVPKVNDRRRAQDLSGLLDLLRHLDTVDDLVEAVASEVAGKSVDSKEFRRILKSHPSAQLMRSKELDIIFRMFDRNRDGFIKEDEQKDMKPSTKSSKKDS